MFDRIRFKKNAKIQLKGNYDSSAGVIAVYFLVSAGLSGFMLMESSFSALLTMTANGVLGFAVTVFFLKLALKKNGEYLGFNTFVTALAQWITGITSFLWFTLWSILWMLLFIIPGFVKMLAYSQMFFILAENPAIEVRKAMKMSMVMTNGYKSELFVMAISFAGWFFLSLITCGILGFWVMPYFYVSFANAYLYLKEKALLSALLTPTDFLMQETSENLQTAKTDAESVDVTQNTAIDDASTEQSNAVEYQEENNV